MQKKKKKIGYNTIVNGQKLKKRALQQKAF